MEKSTRPVCVHCFQKIEPSDKEDGEEVMICDKCKDEWKDIDFATEAIYKEDDIVINATDQIQEMGMELQEENKDMTNTNETFHVFSENHLKKERVGSVTDTAIGINKEKQTRIEQLLSSDEKWLVKLRKKVKKRLDREGCEICKSKRYVHKNKYCTSCRYCMQQVA